ncbi:MAG: tryptophan synthase subunit alpha [Pseudomonadota bacterium]|nr:tryptophan synthase subunit alpha [Pseudomonadota bacterium]
MSRIQQCFTKLKAQGRKALIPYITAGDPDMGNTLGIMHALVKNGADVIELGFPFSDPSSDGPVIQRAIERALARGATLRKTLDVVAQFRATDKETPIVLMGYLNPVEFMGYQKFADAAVNAGIDGVILVDMPPEESHELHVILRKAGLDTIYLVAPTTSDARMQSICKQSSGYVYYVSLKGVTGAAHLDVDSVVSNLNRLRKHTDLPLGVGFGISDGESAARIAAVADAVVVGSALIRRIAELKEGQACTPEQLIAQTSIIADMRAAMDATR